MNTLIFTGDFVIGVGRAIAAFNHFFKKPMASLAGMDAQL